MGVHQRCRPILPPDCNGEPKLVKNRGRWRFVTVWMQTQRICDGWWPFLVFPTAQFPHHMVLLVAKLFVNVVASSLEAFMSFFGGFFNLTYHVNIVLLQEPDDGIWRRKLSNFTRH